MNGRIGPPKIPPWFFFDFWFLSQWGNDPKQRDVVQLAGGMTGCLGLDFPHKLFHLSGPRLPIAAVPEIMCNHCGRYFNPEAAERHIPICANVG